MTHQKRSRPEAGWRSRLFDWVGGAVVATIIGLPVTHYYYTRSLHDSESQMRQLQSAVQDAVRQGLVEAHYNARGQIVALKPPKAPTGLRIMSPSSQPSRRGIR